MIKKIMVAIIVLWIGRHTDVIFVAAKAARLLVPMSKVMGAVLWRAMPAVLRALSSVGGLFTVILGCLVQIQPGPPALQPGADEGRLALIQIQPSQQAGGRQFVPLYPGPVEPLKLGENRWAPTKDDSLDVTIKKQVNSILNKMTREKFNKLAKQLLDLPIESLKMLRTLVEAVFEKALDEPNFVDMYADLCVRLHERSTTWSFVKEGRNAYSVSEDALSTEKDALRTASKKTDLRSQLLRFCQEEFEKEDIYDEIKKKEDETDFSKMSSAEAKALKAEFGEKRLVTKRRMLGNIQFIGELYKKDMLKENVMKTCVEHLLGVFLDDESKIRSRDVNPDKLEALGKLMVTIGSKLDTDKNSLFMKETFCLLDIHANNKSINSRLRFMIRDLDELRSSNWMTAPSAEPLKEASEKLLNKFVAIRDEKKAP